MYQVFPEKVKLDSKIKCKSKNRNDKDVSKSVLDEAYLVVTLI
jgi:hypothetical protein